MEAPHRLLRLALRFQWRRAEGGGELPDFLLPLRQRAAEFGDLEPSALEHALVIEYKSGAGIGWHRDRPQFGDVIGISLLASCTFRLRRKINAKWIRRTLTAEPRSAYCCEAGRARNGNTAYHHLRRCVIR